MTTLLAAAFVWSLGAWIGAPDNESASVPSFAEADPPEYASDSIPFSLPAWDFGEGGSGPATAGMLVSSGI